MRQPTLWGCEPTARRLGYVISASWKICQIPDWGFPAGLSLNKLSESDTLNSVLISNGTTFPQGTSVSANIQLAWYRLGCEHRLLTDIVKLQCFHSTQP